MNVIITSENVTWITLPREDDITYVTLLTWTALLHVHEVDTDNFFKFCQILLPLDHGLENNLILRMGVVQEDWVGKADAFTIHWSQEFPLAIKFQFQMAHVFGVAVGLDNGNNLSLLHLVVDVSGVISLGLVIGGRALATLVRVEVGVGVSSNHQVNFRNILCYLNVNVVSRMTKCYQDIYSSIFQESAKVTITNLYTFVSIAKT